MTLLTLTLIGLPVVSEAQQYYTEDFTTTTYLDEVNTSADWNTDDGELKLFTFELSLEGSYDTPHQAHDVVVDGNHAFVADELSGLLVIDISDPTNPTPLGTYNPSSGCQGLAVSGEHVFWATDEGNGMKVVKTRTYGLDEVNNIGRSLAVDQGSDTIVRARITSTETAGITWELSADGGTIFEPFVASGDWTLFGSSGTDLLWRSTHTYSDVNPTVSDLTIDWLNELAPITSITDIPDDQSGWVRIGFTRSGYDFADETVLPVTGYQVYRRVDDAAMSKRIIDEGGNPSESEIAGTALESFGTDAVKTLGDRTFITGEAKARGEFPPGTSLFLILMDVKL